MSSFGLIEENMELSHIHLAVQVIMFLGPSHGSRNRSCTGCSLSDQHISTTVNSKYNN